MAVLMTPPYLQFFDDNGVPLAGGKVYTYTATGTFSVPKATYTTAAGDVEHPNPVVLDASGRPETGNGSIWLSGTYDFQVKDSLDNLIETTLNVTAFTALPPSSDAYFESFSGNGTQTAFTTSEDLGTDEKAIYVWVDNSAAQYVTNGSFATDTDWTKGAGWTIGAGVATAAGAISTALSQTAALTLTANRAYVLNYTVTRSAGGIIPSIGGTSGVERTASGTYTEVISCGSTQVLAFTGNGFTGTLDNISITVANPKGYEIQNPSTYTISGTSLTLSTAPASGTNNIYVSAPSLLVGAASSSATDAAASAAAAAASETNAATSASEAALSAASLSGTSTTSLTIGGGSKVFVTQSGKFFQVGVFLIAYSLANPANYMHGQVTAYSGTSLTLNSIDVGGSGTYSDWIIAVSGTQGSPGSAGPFSGLTSSTNTTAAMVVGSGASLSTSGSGTIAATSVTGGVAGGGTGVSSLTVYAPLFGGTTSTGPIQSGTVGTSGQFLGSNGAGALPTMQTIAASVISGLPFSKEYISAAQTITFSGSLTLSHGLSVNPKFGATILNCVTGEGGYNAGDQLMYTINGDISSVNTGMSIRRTSSSLLVRYGSSLAITRADTGVAFNITAANWTCTFMAWA